jgi:hypothetical protein
METHERAMLRIIAPLEVLAGVLLIASVAAFAAVTANPDMDLPGAIARLGSMPVVLALFALVTATTLLDEQVSVLRSLEAIVRPAPESAVPVATPEVATVTPAVVTPEVVAPEVVAPEVLTHVVDLSDTNVLAAQWAEPDLPALRNGAEMAPWWAEWMAQSDVPPSDRLDDMPEAVAPDAGDAPDEWVDLIEERASRPLVDLIA